MASLSDSLAPFANRTFRGIWLASLSSNLGTLVQGVAAAWLMTSLTRSADLVALVQASTTLPIMLFSLVSGALADNFDRRRIMLTAQGVMLVVSLLLALAAWAEVVTPWLLLALTFLIGCGTALNNPSWQASVGDIVQRRDLPAAVALNSIGFNLSRSVGPALGGAIVAAGGAAAAFVANAVSYLPVIVVIARWRPDLPLPTLPRETLRAAVGAGLRYVAMSPNIGRVLLRAFVFGFGAIAVQALLPLVVRDRLGGGVLVYGLLLGAFGVGAIGGAFLGGILRGRLTGESIVRIAFAGFAVAAVVAGWSRIPVITGAAMAVAGCSWVLALARFNVTVQLASPRWVVGRTLSLYQMATFGGMALGSWLSGLAAEGHGLATAFGIAGAVLALGAALGLLLPMPEDSTLSLDPANRFREPDLALEIKPRSGPILVTIEYEIREADTPAFLEAMTERRRIRRRNGARNWTLARDLERPTHWIESYHVPTWTEYVRHNQRTTLADVTVAERIRSLHAGERPPAVRRLIERPTDWAELAVRHPVDEPFH
jgi:MFS family permease